MYLSPLGAATLEQVIIRPEILTDQVNRFIAEITDKMNLSVIKPGQRNLTHVWRRQVDTFCINLIQSLQSVFGYCTCKTSKTEFL